jgi:hypothetical protein
MPDDHPMTFPRRDPERIDLAAIKSDLESISAHLAKLPTRQELALRPIWIMVGSAGLVIAWIELFRRVYL